MIATVSRLLVTAACVGWIGSAVAAEPRVFPPGSRIGLVPPGEMKLAKGVTGFRDAQSGASIFAVEMPPEAFPGLAASFTDQALQAQGFALKSRAAPTIGSAPAILITGEQAENGQTVQKTVLLAADPTLTALVIGQAPAGASEAVLSGLRNALETVVFRAPLGIDEQLSSLPFRIGNRAGFRPVRAMAGNSVLLTDGPQDAAGRADQPMLIVAESFVPPPPAAQREAFARQALAANNFIRDINLERSQGFRQGGADWHEIVAKAKETQSGVDVVVMQTIRFEGASYVRSVGVVRVDQRDDVLPRFRAIVDSVVPR